MKPYIKILLLLALPLAWFILYALSPYEIGHGDWALEAPDLSGFEELLPTAEPATEAVIDSVKPQEDTIPAEILPKAEAKKQQTLSMLPKADSSRYHILFVGDSMLEGLAPRLCDYTIENDCELTGVIWYNSTTELWAETDTLEHFLRISDPDYVLLCLGSNELFVRDLQKRDKYIGEIVRKLGSRPFVWISPPNWREDTGINELIISHVGRGRYFDSRNLELERKSDRAHPTHDAAGLWMDSVMSWMRGPEVDAVLSLSNPSQVYRHRYHQFILQPVK